MPYLIQNGRLIDPDTGTDRPRDLYLRGGLIERIAPPGAYAPAGVYTAVNAAGLVICPGLVDIHTHLREPGQTHKEDIASGSRAAVLGGVTSLLCMPNTEPALDTPAVLAGARERAAEADLARVYPVGALTERLSGARLTDFEALRDAGAAALSDDGRPLSDGALMEAALRRASECGLPVLSHCEPETEQALRDIALADLTGCPVHICHVSRRETVEAVRAAKARGIRVTAETCPHYLWFTQADAGRIGANAKVNPPLGSDEDRQAVIAGLLDGTIDILATDHAPHHPSEKALPLPKASSGVIGLETLLAAALTALYHTGRMPLPRLLHTMTAAPARLTGLPAGRAGEGRPADLTLFDPEASWRVEARRMASRSRNTPFDGMTLRGRVIHVFVDGKHRVKYSEVSRE
jgi:dihydroorotase